MTALDQRRDSRVRHEQKTVNAFLRRLALMDAAVIIWAVLGAQFVRFGGNEATLPSGSASGLVDRLGYSTVSCLLIVGWGLMLLVHDCYDRHTVGHGPEEFKRILVATFRFFALVAILSYALKIDLARGYVVLAFPVGALALVLARWLSRKWLVAQRLRGQLNGRVLAVGDRRHLEGLIKALDDTPGAGYAVVGACCADGASGSVGRVPVVGTERDAALVAEELGVDIVACTSSWALGAEGLRELGWALEKLDVDLLVSPGLTEVAGPRVVTRPVAGLPLLHIEAPELSGPKRALKSFLDRCCATLGLLAISPLLLVIAILIKREGPGPVFYRQERIGRDEQPFGMFKFRTMVPDAESLLASLLEAEGKGLQPLYKLKVDPRVTRIGRFLRKYSLDELPQLLNVVRGEMSLIGPRPQVPFEVASYEAAARRRLLVKPGMTGLWQVNGRSDLSWEDAVRLDLYYVENWSVVLDLMILLRTFRAVRKAAGAY